MAFCCVFGLGYSGLPAAFLFAHSGRKVLDVDINSDVVENETIENNTTPLQNLNFGIPMMARWNPNDV